MNNVILIIGSLCIVTIILVVIVLVLLQTAYNKKMKKAIDKLDVEKNIIAGTPIACELSKIESFLKNEKLEIAYNNWQLRHEDIKNNQIPKLSDMIIETEYILGQKNYKTTEIKIAKLEIETYKVRTNSEELLSEIKVITTSEQKNREIITKLKTCYRELYQRFNTTKGEYGNIGEPISIYFDNIAKCFERFEDAMVKNEYSEVTKIIKEIDDLLKHMTIVIEEMPAIILLATKMLPTKIKEAECTYNQMVKDHYPLDYLNVEYNINEANKKINDVMERSKVLNLEDSLFELKVLMEYFDSLFTDFSKEKNNKKEYDEIRNNFAIKFDKLNDLIHDIFTQISQIKDTYNLTDKDLVMLNTVKDEVTSLDSDYHLLLEHNSNNTFAYSKMAKEFENLTIRLEELEGRLSDSLSAIGSMKEDEARAHQQMEEIKLILKESKNKIREYNLPIVPDVYFMEFKEASEALKDIQKELSKKPITIELLNTRVDTARDLALKLVAKANEIIKNAKFAETAIIYGNRYRSSYDDLDKNLTYSEVLFYKGDYKKALEITINVLNKIEPGIYNKLCDLYGKE